MLRGKQVRSRPERAHEDNLVMVPHDFYKLHRFVTLKADVMFVNSVPFLVTLSRKIRLRTAEHIPNCSVALLGSSLMKVIQMYG